MVKFINFFVHFLGSVWPTKYVPAQLKISFEEVLNGFLECYGHSVLLLVDFITAIPPFIPVWHFHPCQTLALTFSPRRFPEVPESLFHPSKIRSNTDHDKRNGKVFLCSLNDDNDDDDCDCWLYDVLNIWMCGLISVSTYSSKYTLNNSTHNCQLCIRDYLLTFFSFNIVVVFMSI